MSEMNEEKGKEAGASRCPGCGTAFVCGMTAGLETCWCASLPPLLAVPAASAVPAAAAEQCYCPACLTRKISAAGSP